MEPLDFNKLNEIGMSKGIASSVLYQVFCKDGLEGLKNFVEGYVKHEPAHKQYLDQHHRLEANS
jgi:hypothetical protein